MPIPSINQKYPTFSCHICFFKEHSGYFFHFVTYKSGLRVGLDSITKVVKSNSCSMPWQDTYPVKLETFGGAKSSRTHASGAATKFFYFNWVNQVAQLSPKCSKQYVPLKFVILWAFCPPIKMQHTYQYQISLNHHVNAPTFRKNRKEKEENI